jgi:hypothetical protein
MNGLKTKSAVKKHLKKCQVKVSVGRTGYGFFKASLRIEDPTVAFDKTFLHVEAQANDLSYGDNRAKDSEPESSFRHLLDISGFYAVQIDCKERLDLYGSDYENPERARVFFQVIREIISDKNLGYVYPKCVLSQVLAALESLGCYIEFSVNGQDVAHWNRDRRALRETLAPVTAETAETESL